MNKKPLAVLETGCLAFYDLPGRILLPCKVVSIKKGMIKAVVTVNRFGYKLGQEVFALAAHGNSDIIPRKAVSGIKSGHPAIHNFTVKEDS